MYKIRDLETYDEMKNVRALQQEIWGFDDASLGLYPPVLKTAATNGGVVLGAVDEETDKMIGFLFSFIGREKSGLFKLCSQNMGVLKDWRRYGIAEELKQEQRRRTIDQGLPLITWTYDPLEGPNANLNLHKLRAISRTYYRDYYGIDFGTLNAGLPSDRLLVEWWVSGARQSDSQETDQSQAVAIFSVEGQGVDKHIADMNLDLQAETLELESVPDIHPLKNANMSLALDWRLKMREAFESYFAKGYIATDFTSTVTGGERRNCYILQKSSATLLATIGIE
ncbi:MAG: hypothetical protein KDJ52_23580 [Anaerolineae bacterium]|nr:hypothetical protein [Anaerolineae bacterium]